ncbi:MAG: hypothetical protein ACO3YU_05530, partial [Candidatus Nanopelagicales bacterium]
APLNQPPYLVAGLGLAIALEDARLHGGWLEAWGEPGAGACFRLTLPRIAGGHVDHAVLPISDEATDSDPGDDRDDSNGAFSRERPSVRHDHDQARSEQSVDTPMVVTVNMDRGEDR